MVRRAAHARLIQRELLAEKKVFRSKRSTGPGRAARTPGINQQWHNVRGAGASMEQGRKCDIVAGPPQLGLSITLISLWKLRRQRFWPVPYADICEYSTVVTYMEGLRRTVYQACCVLSAPRAHGPPQQMPKVSGLPHHRLMDVTPPVSVPLRRRMHTCRSDECARNRLATDGQICVSVQVVKLNPCDLICAWRPLPLRTRTRPYPDFGEQTPPEGARILERLRHGWALWRRWCSLTGALKPDSVIRHFRHRASSQRLNAPSTREGSAVVVVNRAIRAYATSSRSSRR